MEHHGWRGGIQHVLPGMITNVQYDLPKLSNVVFSNGKYAFIKGQIQKTQTNTCLDLWPLILTMQSLKLKGAIGFTVDRMGDIWRSRCWGTVKVNKEGKDSCHRCSHHANTVHFRWKFCGVGFTNNTREEAIKEPSRDAEAEELVPFRLFLEEEGVAITLAQSNHPAFVEKIQM